MLEEKYNVTAETENSGYLLEKREGRWYIQKISQKPENKEYLVVTFTTEGRLLEDMKKDPKDAIKNGPNRYRVAKPLEPGAFILHQGGCASKIRASERIKLAASCKAGICQGLSACLVFLTSFGL